MATSTNRILPRVALGLGLLALPGGWAAPAAADTVERSLEVSPGGMLEVRLPGGSVEVDTHAEPRVDVDARVSGWLQLQVERTDSGVRIEGSRRGGLPFGFGHIRLHVRVPEEYGVDLRTAGGRVEVQELSGPVTAYTSGGHVDLTEIAGDVRAETTGGRIEAREIHGDVDVETSGGSIRVSEVTGSVRAGTTGGSIRIHEVGGPVDARTSGGSVEVRFEGSPEGRLVTSGGGIEIEMPAGAGVTLDARTSGGRVEIDDDLAPAGASGSSRFRGDLNGGGPRLDAETSGGSIRVRAR